jgi:hypothetical protein
MPSPPPVGTPPPVSPVQNLQNQQQQPTENHESRPPLTSTAADFHAQQNLAGILLSLQLRSSQPAVDLKRPASPPDRSREQPVTSHEDDSFRSKRLRHEQEKPGLALTQGTSTQGLESASNLQCSSDAPIRKLTPEEIPLVIDAFQKNLKQWEPGFQLQPIENQMDIDEPDQRTPEETWFDRLQDTHNLLRGIQEADYSDDTVLAYYVGDQPIGVLVMSDRSIPYIDALVTHPGSAGAGGALIEQAVNTSVEWGNDGMLKLAPVNGNAQKAYEAFGFVNSGKAMTLDPVDNDKWCQQDGQWRLQKYQDKKYLAGFGE